MADKIKIPAIKNIALVAHDHMKKDLLTWTLIHRDQIAKHSLYATGTTGKYLSENLDLKVNSLKSGPLGGDQQIGALIADGKIDMLIFFWDPLEPQPHDPDVKALLRLAVVWNIPVACNLATADFIFNSSLMENDYEKSVTDYATYLKRPI